MSDDTGEFKNKHFEPGDLVETNEELPLEFQTNFRPISWWRFTWLRLRRGATKIIGHVIEGRN